MTKNSKSAHHNASTREALTHFFSSLYKIAQIGYNAAPGILLVTLLIRVIQAIMPVISAYIFKLIFDQLGLLLEGNQSFVFEQDLLPEILLFGFVLLISQTLIAFDTYINEEMGRRMEIYMTHVVYTHLLSLKGMHYFESPSFHDTLRQAQQINWMPTQFIRQVSSIFGSLLTLLSFFGIVMVFSPLLAFILVIATAPSFLAQLRFRRKRFDMSWDNSPKERKAWYLGMILSQTNYAREVRLFNLGDYILNQFIKARKEVHQEQRALHREELQVNTVLYILGAIITVGTYLFVISNAFAQQITIGDVTLYIESVRNIQTQLGSLSWSLVSLSERTLFFSHYENLMSTKSTLEQLEPLQNAPPLQHELELRAVSFRYNDEADYVLQDINLVIRKDESLALVGLNGAGKTTLVKLLARFYDPTEGQVLWDGVDIRHFTPDSMRERMGAVFQDFMRFDLTARENIGLGDVQYIDDLDRIRQTAQQVGVDEFIQSLPLSYETVLSRWLVEKDDEGTDLSGGQWQKVAISRTYIRDVDVLMLDEPTSALDAEAEYDIYQRFADISENRATVLISHRFSTVKMADKIAVIEDGCIIEYGTHIELLDLDGTYARLYSLQAQQYN